MLGSQLDLVPNSLYYGDCLQVLEQWPASVVDFVYLDPPFNSKADYNVLYGSRNGASAQTRVFSDTWHWDAAAAERMETLGYFAVISERAYAPIKLEEQPPAR